MKKIMNYNLKSKNLNTKSNSRNNSYSACHNYNGGFYVGRYEAGNASGTLVSKANIDTYINVTRSQAKGLADGMYTGKSYLLTDAAWDRTLGWIIQTTNNVDLSAIVGDSKSWRNYSDSTFEGHGSKAKTGAFGNNTKVNNIYDLAGNVYEWTSAQSPSSSNPCVFRGGVYGSTGSFNPASSRFYSATSVYYDSHGFRVALFL